MALESTDSTVDVAKKQRECFPSDRVVQLNEIRSIVNTTAPDWQRAASCADGIDYEIRCYIHDVPSSKWKWTDAEERCYGTLCECVACERTVNDDYDSVADCIRNLNSAISNLDTIRNAVRPDLTLQEIVIEMDGLGSEFAVMTREELQASTYGDALARLDSWMDHFEQVKQSVGMPVLDQIDHLLTKCNDNEGESFLIEAIMDEQYEFAMLEIREMHDRIEAVWVWVRERLADLNNAMYVRTELEEARKHLQNARSMFSSNSPHNKKEVWDCLRVIMNILSTFQDDMARLLCMK